MSQSGEVYVVTGAAVGQVILRCCTGFTLLSTLVSANFPDENHVQDAPHSTPQPRSQMIEKILQQIVMASAVHVVDLCYATIQVPDDYLRLFSPTEENTLRQDSENLHPLPYRFLPLFSGSKEMGTMFQERILPQVRA